MINTLKSVFNFFSVERNLNILFLGILSLSMALFITAIVLSFFTSWFNKKRRILLVVYSIISLSLGASVSIYNTYFIVGYVFMFCLDLFFITIVACIPNKKIRVTKKQKEFVEFIDEEIKSQAKESTLKPIIDKIILNKPPIKEEKPQKPDVDFSHVKAILERLEYFPLTVSDKKQVNSLRANLIEAQNGNMDFETKRRINDGLSDLLKIMSKYGV